MKWIRTYLVLTISLVFISSPSFASHEIMRWRDNQTAAVSLTFDDGYVSQYTSRVDLLNARNFKGTFFLRTDWIQSQGDWEHWRNVAEQGHEIGSHSVNHQDLTQLSETEIREELSESQDAINLNITNMYLTNSDLELVNDGGAQTVGIRFNGVDIPQGATIVNAYVQFQVDETSLDATSLIIEGEDIDDALAFTSSAWNISNRTPTDAYVQWSPVAWTTVKQAGPDQQTPDISSVIQEIVDRIGWVSSNSLVVIITGTGMRVAESFDRDQGGAPLL